MKNEREFQMPRSWYAFGYFGIVSSLGIGIFTAFLFIRGFGSPIAGAIAIPFIGVAIAYVIVLRQSGWWPKRQAGRAA